MTGRWSATRLRHVSVTAIAFLALSLLAGCKTELYSKISEQEANEMVSTLSQGGIASSKASPDGKSWSVTVSESDIPAALTLLRSRGLPRDRFQSLGDVFKKEGLVSSPSEERIRFIYAMSQELSNTLSQIDGVISARVHVVIPANDPLAEKVIPASASVFIKHRPELNTRLVTPAIKSLVFRSIEGLSYDDISVSFFPSEESQPAHSVKDEAWYASTWFELCLIVSVAGTVFVALSAAGRRGGLKRLLERARTNLSNVRADARASN
jgi:type III secretion protein J